MGEIASGTKRGELMYDFQVSGVSVCVNRAVY